MTASKIAFYEHPAYADLAADWQVYQDLFEGRPRILRAKYLTKLQLEMAKVDGAKLRGLREGSSYYTNLEEPVESTWISIILRKAATIPPEVIELFQGHENDVDGEGHDIMGFIREKLAPMYLRFGRPIIVSNAPDIQVTSEAEREALGVRPFWQVLNPLEVKDWQYLTGPSAVEKKFKFIRSEYDVDKERAEPTEKPGRACRTKILQIRNGKVYQRIFEKNQNKDWVLVGTESKLVGWNELPIAHLDGDSWMGAVSQQQLKLFNLESALDTQLCAQAFQRILISGMTSKKAKLAFNEYAVNFLPDGAQVTIAQPTNPVALQARIDQTVSYLWKVAFNRSNQLAQNSKESMSADASQEMKSEQVALALQAVSDLENLINIAVRHIAKFRKQENFDKKITLNRDITPADIDRKIQIVKANYNDVQRIPEFHRQYLAMLVDALDMPDKEKIKAEIKKIGTAELAPVDPNAVRTQIMQQFGQPKAGNSAGA